MIGPTRLPWWTLLGGIGGAIYVTGQSTTVAVLGVALFTVATVAGSTGAGLLVDKVGLGPGGPCSGHGLAGRGGASGRGRRLGRLWWPGRRRGCLDPVPAAWPSLAGAAGAVQVGVNGRVSIATGQPLVATLVNFAVGLAALLLIVLRPGDPRPGGSRIARARSPRSHGCVVGGAMGVLFVAGSAWSVRALGVLLLSLIVLAGHARGCGRRRPRGPDRGRGRQRLPAGGDRA